MNATMHRLRAFLAMVATDTFAICLLAAVIAAAILAFGFGADAHLIMMILVLGVVTALAETTIRARNHNGDPK